MHHYLLAIPLPASTRSRLASFCYGLPQVRWVEEENFHLALRHFGPLNDVMLSNIQERLENLFFHPFLLTLQGIGHFHAKGNKGTLWIGIADNPHLASLRKEMERQLRDLKLAPEEHSFHPIVTLGYYDHLNPQRLGDYLSSYADFQSLPIEVTNCLLMRSIQTPKHLIYETMEEYLASPSHHDLD